MSNLDSTLQKSFKSLSWIIGAMLLISLASCGMPFVENVDQAQADAAGQSETINWNADGGDGMQPGDECTTDFDCKEATVQGKTPCSTLGCNNGYCGWAPKGLGSKCSDPSLKESACVQARCDETGTCALVAEKEGTLCENGAIVDACEVSACDSDSQCKVMPKLDKEPCGLGACGNWCKAGQCVTAPDTAYDDNNPCTKDFCSQNTEIVHEPITAAITCDDGDPCSGDGTCSDGKCVNAAGGDSCNDGIPCTVDSCGKDGCDHKADDTKCTDGDACFQYACDLAAGCTATTANPGAACDDGDKCTKGDACDAQGQCAGPENICKCGADADCDKTDKCLPRFCNVTSGACEVDTSQKVVCDKKDDGLCGVNTCDPKTGQCALMQKNTGKSCDDNDVCTSTSVCKDGACDGAVDKKCDDKNVCTLDQCDPLKGCNFTPAPGGCDDGNVCTDNDACSNGGCAGAAKSCDDGVACTFDGCDKTTGKCTHAPKAATCDDANPCTTDTCDAAKGCQNVADNAAKCDDTDKCTLTACSAGKCVVTSLDKSVAGCGCGADAECNDNNSCTKDTCNNGDCKFDPAPLNGSACVGASLCVVGDKCAAGTCGGGKPKVCDDKNPCTDNTCAPKTGKCTVQTKSNGTACDADGNLCTVKDACSSGKCVAGKEKNCSTQGNACNLASCDAKTGSCATKPAANGVSCDDGKFCTDADVCNGAGKCVAGKAKNCASGGDACNAGSCDEGKKACVKKPKASGTACSDGNACTQTDKCNSSGTCVGSNLKSCSGDQCNAGVCVPSSGKCDTKPKPNGTGCSDSNACTTKDACFYDPFTFGGGSGGGKSICKGSSSKNCSGDACNVGVCNPSSGACGKKPKKDGTSCSDGEACTSSDKCKSGVCAAGTWTCQCKLNTDCNDKNTCTKDTCSSGKCSNTITSGAVCSDGNACTINDKCTTKGTCAGSKKSCNDNNACTADSCGGGSCANKPLAGKSCSDGTLCTTSDKCSTAGKCVGTPLKCNDGNACTDDKCKSGKCSFTKDNTNSCSDGKACTVSDYCLSGSCISGKTKTCNDGNPCTTDACSKGSCVYTANKAGCSDGNPCTVGDKCSNKKCVAGTGKKCNDGNVCTIDLCSKTGVCSYPPLEGKSCKPNSFFSFGCCVMGKCVGSKYPKICAL